ncbi:hypothetical protein E6O75_ATG01307 [Venturia nashicola]|uniref:Uncharacterized protein n=1 Tax=Venturia nashicola TaxID=86259 RepID=A0A4Z1PGL6_9PEZI|nr:hypothetical protein E6O75_ATG01307 [Venturia nashicola]
MTPDSDFSPYVPSKEPSVRAVTDIIAPGDLTSTYGGNTLPTDFNMITRTTNRLKVRAASHDIALLPPPHQIVHSNAEAASHSENDDIKNTFRVLMILLLIVAVIAIITIRIVKQDRKKKKAVARAAEMELALQAAIQQQASPSSEELLPSYAEAIAAGAHGTKLGGIRRSVVVADSHESRRAASFPDPADIGNSVRPGGIFQPPISGTDQVEAGSAA